VTLPRLDDRIWDTAVLAAREPVAVVFWADWCLPSRTAVETVEAMAEGGGVRARLGLLNVDENPRTTERYGIQGLPTLIVFRNAEPAERRVGLMSRGDVLRLLRQHGS
jgi:thioredoxin 1